MSLAAVVHLDNEELEWLENQAFQRERSSIDLAFRSRARGRSAALLVHNDLLRYLALVKRTGPAGELRSNFQVSHLFQMPVVASIRDMASYLPPAQRDRISHPGDQLSDAGTKRAQQWIEAQDAPAGQHFRTLLDSVSRVMLEAGEKLELEERDHVVTALELAGMDGRAGVAELQSPSGEDNGLLAAVRATKPFEDDMIFHDTRLFGDWIAEPEDRLGTASFVDDQGRKMSIWSVNRKQAEEVTGADLIYYHIQRRSLLLVQYKRMELDAERRWYYRPNSHFRSQLLKLQRMDKLCGAQKGLEWRLKGSPSLFKFCKLEHTDYDKSRYVPGVVAFRDHVQQILEDESVIGPAGGDRIAFDNGVPYLSPTQFVDLAGAGLIGTSGTQAEAVWDALRGAVEDSGAATVAVLSSDKRGRRREPTRPTRVR